jgi:uncharacterized protein
MKNSLYYIFMVLTICLGIQLTSCNQEQESRGRFQQASETVLEPPRSEFVRNIPDQAGYVNDFENTYSPAEKQRLEELLASIERETTMEIVVVTLDSAMSSKEEFDYNTLWIGNRWGVGQRGDNNGILIGISRSLRVIRIHYGSAIEQRLSNEQVNQIVNADIIPHLKAGNYYQGTRAGIESLVNKLP